MRFSSVRHPPSVTAIAVALLAAACGAAVQRDTAVASPRPERIDSALAVQTFDSAWSRIRSTYYDSTFHGRDWDAVRRDLLPQASRARDAAALRRVIESMFERLGESHFALIPAEVASAATGGSAYGSRSDGDLGLEVRILGNDAIVSRVVPDSPAAAAGVSTGWVLDRVDTIDIAALIAHRRRDPSPAAGRSAEMQLPFAVVATTRGAAGERVRVRFRDGRGARRDLSLVRQEVDGVVAQFGRLPAQLVRFESERFADRDGCIGVIRFNVWMLPIVNPLDDAMAYLRACRGIVIDLRGNVGGVAALVMGVGGWFLDSAQSLGALHARGMTLQYVANPRRSDRRGNPVRPYGGQLAILVDGQSVSTSEIFAAGMQAIGRARVFGQQSAGEALPATLVGLPNGDVMMHVVGDFSTPDGRRLEAEGVRPDEVVPLSRSDLLAQRDAALDAARRWISASSATAAPATAPAQAERIPTGGERPEQSPEARARGRNLEGGPGVGYRR
jgi:carboxyl-terminal processing protease